MNVVCGIDTGKQGAVAVFENGTLVNVIDTPTIAAPAKGKKKAKSIYSEVGMVEIIRSIKPDFVVIEHVHSMPGQSCVSTFSQGQGYGLWIGIVAALGIPFKCVAPQTWKKALLKDIGGDEKQRSVLGCQRLIPESIRYIRGPRGGYNTDRADAILIALYEVKS